MVQLNPLLASVVTILDPVNDRNDLHQIFNDRKDYYICNIGHQKSFNNWYDSFVHTNNHHRSF